MRKGSRRIIRVAGIGRGFGGSLSSRTLSCPRFFCLPPNQAAFTLSAGCVDMLKFDERPTNATPPLESAIPRMPFNWVIRPNPLIVALWGTFTRHFYSITISPPNSRLGKAILLAIKKLSDRIYTAFERKLLLA
jgi:hypothetical protein